MSNALFSFDDRATAQRALERLVAEGLPPSALRLHAHDETPNGLVTAGLDEVVTGGFLTNFASLFEGIFEWGDSPHDASAYAETVRRGGAVLSVEVRTQLDEDKADAVLAHAGVVESTGWSSPASSTPAASV